MASLGSRVLLLLGLAAAGSSAFSQCTDGIYTEFGACNQGIQARWALSSSIAGQSFAIDVRGIYDPARNMTAGPSSWTSAFYATLYPAGQAGDCLKIFAQGSSWNVTTGAAGYGWPEAALSGYPTGRFEIRYGYTYPAGTWHYLYFRVYKTGGIFHCEAPPPVINPPATEDDPDVVAGKVVIRPFVYQDSDPQEDVNVYLRGAKSADGITGADGSVRFVDTGTGTFRIVVNGYSESGKKLYAEKTFVVESVKLYRPIFYFDANGNLSDFEMYEGGSGGGGGIGEDALSSLLETLFVPQDETVEGLFRSMDEFFNWGPIGVIQDIWTYMQMTNPGQTEEYLRSTWNAPSLYFDTADNKWKSNGGTMKMVDMQLIDEDQSGWWLWLRRAMGALVYISFFFFLVKVFIPKHVV